MSQKELRNGEIENARLEASVRELKQSEEEYRRLLEEINDSYILTQDEKIVFANAKYLEMVGYTAQEVIGEPFTKFIAPELVAQMRERYQRRMSGKPLPEQFEIVLVTKNGERVPAEIRVGATEYEGRPALTGIYRDITERKRAEEELRRAKEEVEERVRERTAELERAQEQLLHSEQRYQALFEHAGDAIIVYDANDVVQLWNRQAERMFGYKAEEMVGRKWDTTLPDDLKQESYQLLSQVKEKGFFRNYETERVRKDGTRAPVELTRVVLRDDQGNIVGISAIVRDISGRKRLEGQRKDYELGLEIKIGELERAQEELQEAQERLIRSEKLIVMGQFASSIAHELRNPLGVINNAAYYLNMKLGDADEEVRKYLKILEKEVAISNSIIGDILDFAETRELLFQEIDISSIVDEALSRALVPEGVEVAAEAVDSLPRIMADPYQLQQVFLNLISNALEAMPQGGRLLISSGGKDNFIEIEFKDSGVGIPEQNLKRIFEPLFTTKPRGGVGIGLPMSRFIIEAHGGEIEVRSRVGEGTTFIVKLPITPPPAGEGN